MFQIIVNNKEIILSENSKISLKYNSPLLHDAEATGIYSLTLQAPVCPENNLIFGQSNLPEKKTKNRFYDFEFRLYGNFFQSGILVLRKKTTSEFYEFNLNIGSAVLVAKCGDINLKDISWGSYTLPRITGTKKWYQLPRIAEKYPTGEAFSTDQSSYKDYFSINISSTQFTLGYAIASVFFQTDLDATMQALQKKINDFFIIQCGYKDRYMFFSATTYDPLMTFSIQIFRQDNTTGAVSTSLTYTATAANTFFADDLATPSAEYDNFVFPQIYNAKFYDDKKKGSVFINTYIHPNFLRNIVNEYSVENLFTLVPWLKLKFVLEKIFNKIGMTYSGSFFTDTDMQKLILYSNYALDKVHPFLPFLNYHNELIEFINLVPNIKIIDFLQKLKGLLGIYFVIKENNVEFRYRIDRFRETAADDWTDIEQSSEFELKEIKNYVLKYEDNLNYTSFDGSVSYDYFPDFKINNTIQAVDTKEEIKSAFGTLHKHQWESISIDNQKGNSVLFDLGITNPVPLRLLFWNGLVTNSLGTLPSATYSSTNYDLVFAGANGLYEKFWKEYIEMLLKAEPYSKSVNIDYKDLAGLMMDKKKRFENLEFFATELNISLSNKKDSLDEFASGFFLKI